MQIEACLSDVADGGDVLLAAVQLAPVPRQDGARDAFREQSSGKIERAEYLAMKCCEYSTIDHFCIPVHLLLGFGFIRNLCRLHKDLYIKYTILHNFFSQHGMCPFYSFQKISLGLD